MWSREPPRPLPGKAARLVGRVPRTHPFPDPQCRAHSEPPAPRTASSAWHSLRTHGFCALSSLTAPQSQSWPGCPVHGCHRVWGRSPGGGLRARAPKQPRRGPAVQDWGPLLQPAVPTPRPGCSPPRAPLTAALVPSLPRSLRLPPQRRPRRKVSGAQDAAPARPASSVTPTPKDMRVLLA